ncbi:Seven-in-absentia protein TRAF-like domain [Trinorchestia longiramus]|nr:Seven-in-absentia protein TRAF-like domain [Trinorchestia longiramus]
MYNQSRSSVEYSEKDSMTSKHHNVTKFTPMDQTNIELKNSFRDSLVFGAMFDEVRGTSENSKDNSSSFRFSTTGASSVAPTILLSRTESTGDIDEPQCNLSESSASNVTENKINGSTSDRREFCSDSAAQFDCNSDREIDHQETVCNDKYCQTFSNSENRNPKISNLGSAEDAKSMQCDKYFELENYTANKYEYLQGNLSCSFGKLHNSIEGNRILPAVKDDDRQTDGPILTNLGVANRASGVEAGVSRPAEGSKTLGLPDKCSDESNFSKNKGEKLCNRLRYTSKEFNKRILPPFRVECSVLKSEKAVFDSGVFETNLIVKERKLKRAKGTKHVARVSTSKVCDKHPEERTVPQRLIVPPTITVGRSASFNEKYIADPNKDIQPRSRQRCHSASSRRHSGEHFHCGNLKKFLNSPKRNKSKDMANASPAASESSSINSNTENKKNTIIHQIGSNIARKISKQGKCDADSKAPDNLGSKEFREAMSSATVACNGRTGSNPTLVCYEELLKLFLCPICGQLMSPPLPQCRKGHLVCSECKLRTKNACPICKQRYAEGFNLMMGQVYQLLKLPCRFSSHGCVRLLLQREKAAHEADCSYRPVSCLHAAGGCPLQLPYTQMLEHIKNCTYKAVS